MSIIDEFNTFAKLHAKSSIFNNLMLQKGGDKTTNSNTQSDFQKKINQATDQTTYKGSSMNLSFNLLKLVYEYVILYSLKIMNFFYESLEDELKSFAGDSESANEEIEKNRNLLKSIEKVIENPLFKEKWNEFTDNISELFGTMIEKMRKEVDSEFSGMLEDISELFYKNIKTTVLGSIEGVIDGICAVPPLMPFCEIATVAGVGSKLTSDTFITFMKSASRIANSFSRVFGDTSDKFAGVIKETIDMYETITDLISKTSDMGVGIINQASENVSSLKPTVNQNGGKTKRVK